MPKASTDLTVRFAKTITVKGARQHYRFYPVDPLADPGELKGPWSPKGSETIICFPPPKKKTQNESRARRLISKKWKKIKDISTLL